MAERLSVSAMAEPRIAAITTRRQPVKTIMAITNEITRPIPAALGSSHSPPSRLNAWLSAATWNRSVRGRFDVPPVKKKRSVLATA